MRATTPLLAMAVRLATACFGELPSGSNPSSGTDAEQNVNGEQGKRQITVMTRNMHVGTDVDAVIGAIQTPSADDDLPALLTAIETLRQTNFPARAAAIAAEIAHTRPWVVGLQEVSQIDLTLPPLGIDIHQDILPALLGALSAQGLA